MKSTYSKIHCLLTPDDRKTAMMLLGFMIVGMFLELMGIGLLVPVIILLLDDDLPARYPELEPFFMMLGNPTHEQQVQIVMLALIGIYFIKNIYLGFLAWRQARFSTGLQVQLSQQLFTIYLRQPYTFHLQRNSAQLIRNITGEVGQFLGRVVNPVLSLTAEGLVLLGIVTMLVTVEPMGAITVILVLLAAAWAFYRTTRTRITRWGQTRQYHDGQRIQHLNQGLGGAKDVKLLGREADFLIQYHIHNSKSALMAQFLETLQKLPRLWLELLAVIGLAALVLTMLAHGRDTDSIIPTMGLFAAAAFRLMPSANRMLTSVQSMRFGLPVIDNLYEELQLSVPDQDGSTHGRSNDGELSVLQREIKLSNVTYNYPDSQSAALIDVYIDIKQGESVGFIGPSGSGKSTLVDVILGLLTPESGQILIDGCDIKNNLRVWQDQIGYVPQSIYLTDDTLRRNIAFGLPEEQIDDVAIMSAVQAAQLEGFVTSLPEGLDTIVGERGIRLSGGQRQRIGIARALYHDPNVLVLDEATSALDTATEVGVMQAVKALHGRKTIIIVAHRLSTVEHCDCLYRLDKGRVVEKGTPKELLRAG